MAWFESRKTKEKKSRFKQLVDMAMADGELDPAEQDLLEAVADGLGLDPDEFANILHHPEKVEFRPPVELDDRLIQYAEIVDMMRADDIIKPEEQAFAIRVSGRLGIPPARAPRLIELVMEAFDEQVDWITLRNRMREALKQAD